MPAVINFGEIYFTLNVIFVAIRVIIGSVHGIFLAQRKIEFPFLGWSPDGQLLRPLDARPCAPSVTRKGPPFSPGSAAPYCTRSNRGGSGFPSAGASPSAVSRYCTIACRTRTFSRRFSIPYSSATATCCSSSSSGCGRSSTVR